MDTKGNAYAVSDTSTLAVTRSDLTSQYTIFKNIFPTCKFTAHPVMSCQVMFYYIPFYLPLEENPTHFIISYSNLSYPVPPNPNAHFHPVTTLLPILNSSLLHASILYSALLFLFCSTLFTLLSSAAITSVRFQAVASNVGGSNSGGHVIVVGLSGKYGYSVTVHSTQ
jgi:hypothetical protein